MWEAIHFVAQAAATVLLGWFSLMTVRLKIQSDGREVRLKVLEEETKKCHEDRKFQNELLNVDVPSDVTEFSQIVMKLKAHFKGIYSDFKIRELATYLIRYRLERETKKDILQSNETPEAFR